MPSIKEEIHQELASIYLLDSKERDTLLSQLNRLPGKALSEVLITLKKAKNDQKKYLSKISKIDPQFLKKLNIFLDGNADVLIADAMISKF